MVESGTGAADASLRVRSRDGTSLAVWVEGDGPPLVLVHGSFSDHSAWAVPVAALRDDFTTYAMDRRGFGASEDGADYSIEREFEDVAAVVEEVASRTREPVALWGHSYGASGAMGGAALSAFVQHLVLYEPSLGLAYPDGAIESAEAALAAGDAETAVERMLFDVLQMTSSEVVALRSSDRWPVLLAGAHTAPRECRAEQAWVYEPGRFDAVDAPVLLLSGSESPPDIKRATQQAASALPDSYVHVLYGHGHFAHRTDPEGVVAVIKDFVSD